METERLPEVRDRGDVERKEREELSREIEGMLSGRKLKEEETEQ